jgi:hypothetical protein
MLLQTTEGNVCSRKREIGMVCFRFQNNEIEKYVYPTTTSINSSTAIIPQSQPVNRVSEIMKFGCPSLDNVRSYDNFIISYNVRQEN